MCDCVVRVNEALVAHNAELSRSLLFGNGPNGLIVSNPIIETVKINPKKRGATPKLYASFCPFCGEKYAPRSIAREMEASNG